MSKLNIFIILIIVLVGGFLLYNNKNTSTSTNEPENIINADSNTNDSEVKEFTVVGTNYKFSMDKIAVNKGDTVRIVFINKDGFHDWVIDEFDAATKQIKTGEQETIEFVADQAGTFEYYCSVGQHRDNGMKGNLIVK